jgi:hypothetical protein
MSVLAGVHFPSDDLLRSEKEFRAAARGHRSGAGARHPWLNDWLGDFIDLGGLADRQKRAGGAQTVDWLDRCGTATENKENNLVHRTASGTSLVHDDCPPRTI